jgi:hypothetical protein
VQFRGYYIFVNAEFIVDPDRKYKTRFSVTSNNSCAKAFKWRLTR